MAAVTGWILLLCTLLCGQEVKTQNCGQAPLNTKIVGGDSTVPGAWPWQVSIHYKSSHICGGTLINNQWVLTAAHCVLSQSLNLWTLYFGRQTQAGPNAYEVAGSVTLIIPHPDYNNTRYNNDLALMKLSSPLTFSRYISPICLASSSSQFFDTTSCWATGWGRTSQNVTLPDSSALQEVQIPVIGNNQCKCTYIPTGTPITDRMICAGIQDKGTCQGDSGGPLQCRQGSSWIQAGITSFGIPCATGRFPEVYARVSEFQDWINSQVAGSTVNFVMFTSNGVNQDSSFVCNNTQILTSGQVSLKFSLIILVISAAAHIVRPV